MNPRLSFILPCKPTAQRRPRHMRAKSGIDITYKDARQKANEGALEALLAPWRPDAPFRCVVALCFEAVMPIPKYVSKAKRQAMLAGAIYPAVKPDLDNLAKQLKDAMTRMAFWHDDRQVTRLECAKIYGEEACWRVSVVPLEHAVT